MPIAEDALWRVPPPLPSIALLRGMKSLDVMCGAFWDQATQDSNPIPAKVSRIREDALKTLRKEQPLSCSPEQ